MTREYSNDVPMSELGARAIISESHLTRQILLAEGLRHLGDHSDHVVLKGVAEVRGEGLNRSLAGDQGSNSESNE